MFNKEIENNIINYYNTHKYVKWHALNNEWKSYLLQRWDDCSNIKESFIRIKFNIINHPKCPICGKYSTFYGVKNYIYANTCGNNECNKIYRKIKLNEITHEQKIINIEKAKQTCLEKYGDENYRNREKAKQTCLEKYGVDNIAKLKETQDKYHKTCLEKYGVENFYQSDIFKEKAKQTCLEKYGNENYKNRKKAIQNTDYKQIQEKSKQTKLKKYGDEYYSNREKAKQTCLEKYGDENYRNREKAKQTCLEKYGTEHFTNSIKTQLTKLEKYGNKNYNNTQKRIYTNNIKYGGNSPMSSIETIIKMKQTCLEKYGYNSWAQTDDGRKIIKNNMNNKLIQEKINNTKRKNNTFNISKSENNSYNLLKEKYPDVKHNYKSNLYPFNCDFYIPSLNLYIECNYHWTHGGHPYNENNENDKLLLKKWKNKNTKFYNNAINTWTIRDVNKRNIAKQNNLNYIEFWTLYELQNWLTN